MIALEWLAGCKDENVGKVNSSHPFKPAETLP